MLPALAPPQPAVSLALALVIAACWLVERWRKGEQMYIVSYQKKDRPKRSEEFRTWKSAEAWASEMRAKGYEVDIEKVERWRQKRG